MQTATRNWIGIGVLATVVGATLAARQASLQARQTELAFAREQQRLCEQLRAEHAALEKSQPSAGELESLRGDHAALQTLRAEVAALRAREARTGGQKGGGVDAAQTANPTVPFTAWRNAGRATPESALETALWAATAGETDLLAQLLVLEPDARRRAEALLDQLPESARSQYATPERLIALLTARQIPLGSMQLVATLPQGPGAQLLRVRLQAPEGWTRSVSVAARGVPGDWRLVVSGAAVDRLAAQLKP